MTGLARWPTVVGMTDVRHLVEQFYARCWNAWDDDAVDEILAEDFTFRGSLGSEMNGRDAWRAYRDEIRTGADDYHNEILALVVEGSRAAARLRYSGHHRGTLGGMAPTGRSFAYDGAAFFTAEDDRLTNAWVLGDVVSLREQLADQPRG